MGFIPNLGIHKILLKLPLLDLAILLVLDMSVSFQGL